MTDPPDKRKFPPISRPDSQDSEDAIASDARTFDKVSGLMFEDYQILEELPRGGQALVYKAFHKPTKMKVALKVLPPGPSASARARQYFEREVEIAASLNHPNIVAIRDTGIAQEQYYFSMEYIHGQPLDQYVNSQALSLREKIILFGKICDAMTHAHQRGVIHRDLKPPNILVDERGEPHILDFGLAKAAGSMSAVTEGTVMPSITGQIKGTVTYMSPEQAIGRSDLIDVRTDVYSLGVIVYYMTVGQFPYDVSGSVLDVLQNIQHAEPVRPRQIISRFDSDVEAIVLKALAKDRAQRYQSAAELQHDLQCWLDGLPIVAKSISSLYLLRKIITRHRYTSTVVGLLLLIVFSFSYVSFDLYITARRAQQESEVIAKQWSDESNRMFTSYRQVVFMEFLEAWREGGEEGNKRAKWIESFLGDGSKEKMGAIFLLDSNSLAEKEEEFRQGFSDESSWFAEFVIGEQHLKNGYQKQALEAYRRSYQTIQQLSQGNQSILDRLLIMQVKARLYDLTIANKTMRDMSVIGDGDQDK